MVPFALEEKVIEWLMDGDPVIRWQTMRDLLDAPEGEFERERGRIPNEGWGAQFLSNQSADGSWPVARWTGNVWTLLVLIDCGMPAHAILRPAVEQVWGRHLPATDEHLLTRMDLCHVGFWLRLGSYFLDADPRMKQLAELLCGQQMEDGGWNCRRRNYPKTSHGSFHTTFNVLEGLREFDAAESRPAEAKAVEFMLQHRMFKSDKSGEVVSERFLDLTFPSHWHYTFLRGLDYLRSTPEIADPRLDDAFEYLVSRRKPNGRWPVEKRIPGVTLFEMEKMGSDSRWNTLRALRCLKARTLSSGVIDRQKT